MTSTSPTPFRRTGRGLALAAAAGAALAPALLIPAAASASTQLQPVVHTYSGPRGDKIAVPAGVYRVSVDAAGGGGGDGQHYDDCSHGRGGKAGEIGGYLDVQPGDVISFRIGAGGHLSGLGGAGGGALKVGGAGGGSDGGIGGSGNGGGGGGATAVSLNDTQVLVAGGGGGGGGTANHMDGGVSFCGGDGGAGGDPAGAGSAGDRGILGSSGAGGGTGVTAGYDTNGANAIGWGMGGGGGGGGDGVTGGHGGGADPHTMSSGAGGGGGGGTSEAGPMLKSPATATTGGSGSAGFVTVSWGNPTTTAVPPVDAQGPTTPIHAVVSDIDGGGTVDFATSSGSPVPGCTAVPLALELEQTYEATCNAPTSALGASITATYSGDFAYGLSRGTNTVTVSKQADSSTSVSVQRIRGYGNPPVTATVRADGYGTVEFLADGVPVDACSALPLTPAGATIATATCSPGPFNGTVSQVSAVYSGDAAFRASTATPTTIAPTGPATIGGTPPAGAIGSAYSFGYTLGGDPLPTVSTADTLPPGLTLSPTGVLSGTPTSSGSWTFTVAATNDFGTVTTTSTLTVVPTTTPVPDKPPATAPGAPTNLVVTSRDGAAHVTFVPPASDGGAPITRYTVTATPQQGGEPVTASGTGSPIDVPGLTDGVGYLFTVTATNAAGSGPATDPSGVVVPGVAATITGTPPAGTVGAGYTFGYTLAGTPAPTTTVTDGILPPGLALSADGRLTGTPSSPGTWTFTVTAAEAAGQATTVSTVAVAAAAPPAPVATPDLAVRLAPATRMVRGHAGGYLVTVTNTGTAATTAPVTVSLSLGSGLTAVGSAGSGWTCTAHGLQCTHRGALAPGKSLLLGVMVGVGSRASGPVTATAVVGPADASPADNRSSVSTAVTAK